MDQMDRYEEINLMDYFEVIWKRKWLIFIPTFLLTVAAGIYSLSLPKIWQVDAIIQPSKFTVQTQTGQFEEVIAIDPKQVAGQINQASYNNLLASELNIDPKIFPKINAENLSDTKLIRIWVREQDIEKGINILNSLFHHLKSDFDKKIDVEIKGLDTQIAANENAIKQSEIGIKDKDNLIELKKLQINDRYNEIKTRENDIKKKNNDIKLKELEAQSRDIEKDRIKKEIETDRNKLKISEERQKTIFDEMKSVKIRIEELEKQQQKALAEKLQGGEAIALLLYFSQVQENLRYHNALEERLSTEKITQENLMLSIRDKEEQLRQLDNQINQINTQKESLKTDLDNIMTAIAVIKTEIEKVNNEIVTARNDIDKIKNSINTIKSDIQLLINKKARIDFAQLIKEPTPSPGPVAPRKKMNVLIAGFIGLFVFGLLAFFLEYIEKNKKKNIAA